MTFNTSITPFLEILEIHIWFLWYLRSCFSLYLFWSCISDPCTGLISSGHPLNICDFQYSLSSLSCYPFSGQTYPFLSFQISFYMLISPNLYFLAFSFPELHLYLCGWLPTGYLPFSGHFNFYPKLEHSVLSPQAYSSSYMFMSINNTPQVTSPQGQTQKSLS